MFQPAGSLTTGQYAWRVTKQRERPQTANRLKGIICLYGACRGWLVVLVCDSPIIAKLRLIYRKPAFAVFHGQPPMAYLKGSIDNQRFGYRLFVRRCP